MIREYVCKVVGLDWKLLAEQCVSRQGQKDLDNRIVFAIHGKEKGQKIVEKHRHGQFGSSIDTGEVPSLSRGMTGLTTLDKNASVRQ